MAQPRLACGRFLVVLAEVSVDRACRSTSGRKTSRCKRRRVSVTKKVSTAFGPGAGGECEMKHPARVPGQPSAHYGMLVGGIVVEDGMDEFASRHGCLDCG
jgi:hypothetical protein